MKNVKPTAAIALLFLVIMQGCNSSETKNASKDGVLLKFNLQKGKSYTYAMNMDMDTDMQGQKMESEMGFDYTIDVLDDKDSVKTVRTTFDRIKMMMNAGPMNIDFDTNQPQKDSVLDLQRNPMGLMSNMFYAMKGKTFDMEINNRGEVIEVNGLEELQNAVVNSLGSDETMKQAMNQAFQSQFNEDMIKKSFAQSFTIFPDKPVKVGDTWTKNMDVGGMVPGGMNTTFKVKDITDDNVVLDVNSEMNAGGSKGTQTGSMKLDPETGLVTEATLEQTMTSPASMVIKTKITGKEK